MDVTNVQDQLHVIQHKQLTLQDYANVYAAIRHTGVSDKDNYLKPDIVSTILTQYHVSKGLKYIMRKVLMQY